MIIESCVTYKADTDTNKKNNESNGIWCWCWCQNIKDRFVMLWKMVLLCLVLSWILYQKIHPMPTSLASKVLPDLATGALISLGNFGMDEILGQGWYQNTSERGGFLFPRNIIDQLAAHKNFNADQKTERTDSCSSSKWWQACDKSHKAKWWFSCYSFGINSYSSSFKRSHRQRYTEQITTVKVCAENITIMITTIIIKSGTKWFAESSI